MERKLRISHKSFERQLVRFLEKFVNPALRYDELVTENNVAEILGLSYKLLQNYKAKSFRKQSAYCYRLPETADTYKMGYVFERENDCLKLHLKLHVRKNGWSRWKRIAILSVRINKDNNE